MAVKKMLIAGIIMAVSASAMASEKVKNIKGVQGKKVSFSVESNPTTGYGWMIKSLPDELIFVSSSYEQSKDCGEGAVGCSGKETFNFIAQKTGKGELKLIYGQSFDKASWKESIVNVDIK